MPARRFALGAGIAVAGMLTGVVVPAAAEPVLETVAARVDVDGEGAANVELSYLVSAAGEPTETLTFSSLAFGDAEVEDVVVSTAAGRSLDVDTEQVDLKSIVTATLDAPIQPGEQAEVLVEYSVPNAGAADGDRMTVDTPVLVLDDPAATTARGIFTADVVLPPGHSYVEGFPANPEEVTTTGDRTQIRYDVPAAVSLLRVRTTSGDTPWWTLGSAVNGALVVVLVIGGAALYLSYTRGRRRAAEIARKQEPAGDAGRAPTATAERRH